MPLMSPSLQLVAHVSQKHGVTRRDDDEDGPYSHARVGCVAVKACFAVG